MPSSNDTGSGHPVPGFLLTIPEALLRGCRYMPCGAQLPLPGGVITMKSMASDGDALFGALASNREPFVMTLDDLDDEEPDEGARDLSVGVLGIISTHMHDPSLEVTTTEILGVGRVRIERLYMLNEEDVLPCADVTQIAVSKDGEELETIQAALDLLVDGLLEPLEHANEEFVRVLRHFACAHDDPSLNIDRVANILAEHQPALLHEFLTQPSMPGRLALLQDEIRRIHERLLAHINN